MGLYKMVTTTLLLWILETVLETKFEWWVWIIVILYLLYVSVLDEDIDYGRIKSIVKEELERFFKKCEEHLHRYAEETPISED